MGDLISLQIGLEAFSACEVFVYPCCVVQSPAMNWMANDGQVPKQRRTDDAHDGHGHDLLVALAKLSLRTADEVKKLQAATFRTILVPADCDFVTAAKNATTAFADRTRGKGGKHDLGEPHVHLWSAVIGVALDSVPAEAKATLQNHVDDANRGGPSSLLNKVMYARMKKTFDKKFMRFYFSVHPSVEGILDIVMAALTKVGGQEKYGTAPKSSLERDIQAKLDALN